MGLGHRLDHPIQYGGDLFDQGGVSGKTGDSGSSISHT
jgi:hypothetical protein